MKHLISNLITTLSGITLYVQSQNHLDQLKLRT